MSKVAEVVARQKDKLRDEVRSYLLNAAVETIFYVALGKCLKRDMAERFGVSEEDTAGILSQVACQLVDTMRETIR